ncbi:MAG TPA: ferritin-like domain-containing protein [Pirellulales bacterium]|nr:ferritin-like domain-containing protein [Pirellulales bacterium]
MAAQLTWRRTNAPFASSRTDDIWFLDTQVGFAVNSNGHVLKTSDGGNSWVQQLAAGAYLRCVGFANPQIGWVGTLTPSRRLFHTIDGGVNWSQVTNLPPNAPVRVCGMAVVNPNIVYASGTNEPTDAPRMMKTIDGGQNWSAWEMRPHASILIDTFFIDEMRGWVVGGKADNPAPTDRSEIQPVVLFTEDGGLTWTNRLAGHEADFPFGEWGWKIQFLNDRVGFVSLENLTGAAILKTNDGGLTWTRLPVTDPQGNANLEGIGFIDDMRGWVGGWGDADFQTGLSSATDDGGLTWRNANEIGKFLNRFRFFGNPVTVGYASGDTVYKLSADPVPSAAHLAAIAPPLLLPERRQEVSRLPVEVRFNVPPQTKRVTLDIWNRFGGHVGCLVDELRPAAGKRIFRWDGNDANGRAVPDGSYIIRLTADDNAESGLLVVRARKRRRQSEPIRWIRHELRLPRTSPLRALSFRAVAPVPEVALGDAPVPIELPDLSPYPTAVDKARFLLHKASEIEHALLVQYLYAAYSLKKSGEVTDPQQKAALNSWPPVLLEIAREEMGHLLSVQNLLLFTRQQVNFDRDDIPQLANLFPFKTSFEPLTQLSLAKYVVAESPIDAAGIEDIIKKATQGAGMMTNRVGIIYSLLGIIFTKEGNLEHNAAGGDLWSTIIRDLAHVAFAGEPDPSRWHLRDDDLDPSSRNQQAADEEWAPAQQIRVLRADSRQAALDALRDIATQGEGPVQPIDDPMGSHFQRFLSIYRGNGTIPAFPGDAWEPARNVPVDPKLDGLASDPNVIQDPKAKDFARLSDLRYALLLGFLQQYFFLTPGQRGFLIGWCFEEMRSLKSLSGVLTGLPRSATPGAVAALTFNLPAVVELPPGLPDQWKVHLDRLNASLALIQEMLQTHSPGNVLLKSLQTQDQQRLQQIQQSQGLPPALLGRFERIRRILDAATGIGRPSHGRFWNKPLADFVQLSVEGVPIIAPPGPGRGKNSNLIKALKGETPFDGSDFPQMPKDRLPIALEYIAFIEKWIDDGCPEV